MKLYDLIRPFERVETPPPDTLWRFVRWCLDGNWPVLLAAAAITAVAGSLETMTAYMLGIVVDAAVGSSDGFLSQHWLTVAIFGVFFLLARPLAFGVTALMNTYVVNPNLRPMVLSRLYRWTMGHSVKYFDEDFAGRITQKQLQVATGVTELTTEAINTICFALATVIGSVVLAMTINFWVAISLVFWLVIYFAMINWFIPRIRHRAKLRANSSTVVTGQIVDTITNVRTVKLFAHDDYEDREALVAMQEVRETSLSFGKLAALFRFCLMVVAGIIPVLMVGLTLLFWTQGTATQGDIVAAGSIAIRLGQMTGWVSFTLMGMYSHLGEIEDGMKTLTPPHDLTDADGARDLIVSNGAVTFDSVSFAYGRKLGGIDDVTLRIEAGQRVGIVGASGAGKSTLVSLLLRLYDAESGSIRIDGQDVTEVTQTSLRRNIAMVTQDTSMFNRSAMDNIRYGRPDATDEEVIQAAKQAEADEFIATLKDAKGRSGYDTFLGERGVRLSGGQRQRIALARAILKDAPILVLDEATSALDSEVEALIQASLDTAMAGKTVLAIAHRLSTLASMDRIIVLDQGQIVEDGTHSDLLDRGGVYAKFWQRQSGGFIGAEAAE